MIQDMAAFSSSSSFFFGFWLFIAGYHDLMLGLIQPAE
jgi:hypothetical protein